MYQEFVKKIKDTALEQVQNIHTAIPAKVTAYYPETGKIDALPYATYRLPNGKKLPYPKICGVSAFFPQGYNQEFFVIYPIKEDDECLLIFCERTLDIWQGVGDENTSEIQFDTTNAVAIVGFFAKANPLSKESFDDEKMIIGTEDSKIEIYKDAEKGIKITATKVNINGTFF